MKAAITYTAGLSYTLGATKFKQNKTVTVMDEDVIRRCQNMRGFSVDIIKPAVRTVAKVDAAPDVQMLDEDTDEHDNATVPKIVVAKKKKKTSK